MIKRLKLLLEIPSFLAGLVAFSLVFVLMGVMFFVLREDRDRTMPQLPTIGPADVAKIEGASTARDAPFVAIVTLVAFELVIDVLTVLSVIQGTGSFTIGTMLAIGVFIAAAILAVYRSNFARDAFLRKPRLEIIASRFNDDVVKGEKTE